MNNLPPGVRDSDIPGNRPEDAALDILFECISRDMDTYAMDGRQALDVWRDGMAAFNSRKAQREAEHEREVHFKRTWCSQL